MNRRVFLSLVSLLSINPYQPLLANNSKLKITKKIASSNEMIPAIGMGTWICFNVGASAKLRAQRTEVLAKFFELGGGMIDSSPMYGSAQDVLGEALQTLDYPNGLFSADKIWTRSDAKGVKQFQDMQRLWGLKTFDLVQVHNLVNWKSHLRRLRAMKEEGLIKYIGITTSHGLRHDAFEEILNSEKLDFIQLTYNITNREVEQRLLPLAQDKGVAVIANRPFDGGTLFDQVKGQQLPPWAVDYDISNWAQFFLKFIVSHPAITCAIPATSQVEHMQENMGACYGRLPNQTSRIAMSDYIEQII